MPFSLYRKGQKGEDNTPPDFFLATPCSSGRVCANYIMALVDSTAYLTENNLKFDYWLHTEDCHVDDARNFLVHQFMASGAKYLVFIDDDVGWDAINLARLLCFRDADIVAGAYPLKQTNEDYPVRIRRPSEVPTLQARDDGLLEVEGVPTGFMRIGRHVIEKFLEHRKHLRFFPKEADKSVKGQQMTVVFERMMVEGHRWSGDLNFCREARLLGFKVWVDPEMTFTHQGQMRWEGNLGRHLRRMHNVLDPRLDIAINKLIAGDNSYENFKEIHKNYGQLWSMVPEGLKAVYDACLEAKGPILEVGAGLSTIIAGIACQRNGQMVHSLENDMEWFRTVRGLIKTWKIKPVALYYAPLKEYPDELAEFTSKERSGEPMVWYGDFDDLPKHFDLAIIDGPVRKSGREGAYKLLKEHIKDAKWIMDDADDAMQLAMFKKYAEEAGKTVEVCAPASAAVVGKFRHYAIAT